MNAAEYLKSRGRMTENCNIDCDKCPLCEDNNGKGIYCAELESEYPEQAVEIVENWAKENPVKTYLSVLLEKLPNAKLSEKGIPYVCIAAFFGGNAKAECEDIEGCKECWNREYKEDKDV